MGKQIDKEGNVKENKNILTIAYNNIIVDGEKFRGTPGLWELIMEDNPRNYTREDKDEYGRLLIKTNVLHRDFDPKTPTQEVVEGINGIDILRKFGKKGEKERKEVESWLFLAILTRC